MFMMVPHDFLFSVPSKHFPTLSPETVFISRFHHASHTLPSTWHDCYRLLIRRIQTGGKQR